MTTSKIPVDAIIVLVFASNKIELVPSVRDILIAALAPWILIWSPTKSSPGYAMLDAYKLPPIYTSFGIWMSPVVLSAVKMLATFNEPSMNKVSLDAGSIGTILPPNWMSL